MLCVVVVGCVLVLLVGSVRGGVVCGGFVVCVLRLSVRSVLLRLCVAVVVGCASVRRCWAMCVCSVCIDCFACCVLRCGVVR